MTLKSYFDSLSPDQQAAVLAYDGDETMGDPLLALLQQVIEWRAARRAYLGMPAGQSGSLASFAALNRLSEAEDRLFNGVLQ